MLDSSHTCFFNPSHNSFSSVIPSVSFYVFVLRYLPMRQAQTVVDSALLFISSSMDSLFFRTHRGGSTVSCARMRTCLRSGSGLACRDEGQRSTRSVHTGQQLQSVRLGRRSARLFAFIIADGSFVVESRLGPRVGVGARLVECCAADGKARQAISRCTTSLCASTHPHDFLVAVTWFWRGVRSIGSDQRSRSLSRSAPSSASCES